ncbi:hypothetical protein KKB83_02175 [Patescibacteria group bacterium]|nr:hypothetical protein [Patescibacteria group bacterium]
MRPPDYDLDKIKFATDKPTFEKAVGLYENGKVTRVAERFGDYSAVVLGTKPYQVSVDTRRYGYGNCTCYLGQHDTWCKHMTALAIHAVMNGKPLTDEDKKLTHNPSCSGQLGTLSDEELPVAKKSITAAIRYIKPYIGPSRTWFAYQNSLDEGCNRLSAIVAELPVSKQTADILVKMLLRLDKKLSYSGVDDSNGTVGGFIQEVVQILVEYAQLDKSCIKAFKPLAELDETTCFGWEEPLAQLFEESADKIAFNHSKNNPSHIR